MSQFSYVKCVTKSVERPQTPLECVRLCAIKMLSQIMDLSIICDAKGLKSAEIHGHMMKAL